MSRIACSISEKWSEEEHLNVVVALGDSLLAIEY